MQCWRTQASLRKVQLYVSELRKHLQVRMLDKCLVHSQLGHLIMVHV